METILIMDKSVEVKVTGNIIHHIEFVGLPPQATDYDFETEISVFRDYVFDWTNVTLFQTKVLREIVKIPLGYVSTYKGIAKRIGINSAQAVGQALSRNPFSIIYPCHRIVGADGSLVGFGGGLPWKKRLLEFEGRKINDNRLVMLPEDWR